MIREIRIVIQDKAFNLETAVDRFEQFAGY